ncbi:DUF192 domain-containing protein [Neobacillus sp. YIM B02564]|uniref:DUF192 domain-containing protein n=1 Tax=Neobacillus paridis TaxID=2803862 RepID=A0ABS1TLN9_9BACI|nr:DUF192 domain-containing protein [Neobacillus paridis]MBL4952083.1 DUF192 domain-containing protein [Neobacillus paridis]
MKTVHIQVHDPDFEITVPFANSFFSRFFGLMGKKKETVQGMLFSRTNQIHLFFMKFPLDVYYLDKEGVVIDRDLAFPPWRVGKMRKKAKYTLEIPAGTKPAIPIGSKLLWNSRNV